MQTTAILLPQLATQVSAVVLGAVAVFETIGPPLTAFALRFTGEAGKALDADDEERGEEEVPLVKDATDSTHVPAPEG